MKAYMAVLAAAGAAALVGCGGKNGGSAQAAATNVPTATLGASDLAVSRRATLKAGVPLSGPLEPKVNVTVGAPIAEQIVEMFVNEGDAVRQGQPIARFRDDVLRAVAASAQADLAQARAQLNWVAAESTRAVAMFAEGAIARRDHDNALVAMEAARARLALAQSQAANAADRLETATLKAPVTGIVSLRSAQAGDRVDFGKPVLSIVDNRVLQLAASVEARWLRDIAVGRAVSLTVSQTDGDTIQGRISRINPMADPATRQVRLYVDVPNPRGALVGGLYVSGRVLVREVRDAVAVPKQAVRYEGTDHLPVIYVVASGLVARRLVSLGVEDLDQGLLQVTRGVTAGESVVIGPVDGLAEGMHVEVAGTGPARGERATGR